MKLVGLGVILRLVDLWGGSAMIFFENRNQINHHMCLRKSCFSFNRKDRDPEIPNTIYQVKRSLPQSLTPVSYSQKA